MILLDDYNGVLHPPGEGIIGTVRQTFGQTALRNGWKIIDIQDMEQKSKLNRYVRYIYRKMMRQYGTQKVREEGLRLFALTTPERARVRESRDTILSVEFKESYLALLKEWGINWRHITEMVEVIGTPEDLERVLLDLTPIRVRIRKLTPRECMRLQAVTDEDTQKMMDAGLSNSALYKLAGNSICVAPLEGIFTQLLREDNDCLF